ncbi:hypothetical protein [Staphylococcus chromogenes]|uniref:hypothetical protein n=1 Tax=Staphylococcus chromogenes TaxID=46126 RepID=UPI0028850CE9|nr:hypothetical protein [Staphylococcus chromogenes]MDT0700394.1 hypothetical protein [Staphylococcus chromogenes]
MAEKRKQFENKVSILGELKELDVRDLKTKKGVPMKIANLQIKTGEGEVHRATMMAVEYYERDGKKEDNKSFKAIQTMEDEYISIKDISEKKLEESPTVIRVNGSLENNMYKNRQGEVQETAQVTARFVNRVDEVSSDKFGVEFTVQTFVVSQPVRVMDKNEDETDQVKFKVATIDYRGEAHPFEVYADNEYGVADWAEDNAEKGMTLVISGIWNNKYNVVQVERPNPAGVGKPIVDTQREIDNRILVEGIIPVEDEEDLSYITPDEMKTSMKKYEDHKVEVKSSEAKEKTTEVKKGVATSPTVAKKPTITEEDLPF